MNKKLDDKKVVVGMSGGIDSSVAALLLKNEGYEVIGVTLKHLPDELSESPGKTCCSLDDISDAKMTCYTLGIPHYTINVVEEFQREVMDYFIQMYNQGKTPSPCLICDEKAKIKKKTLFALSGAAVLALVTYYILYSVFGFIHSLDAFFAVKVL